MERITYQDLPQGMFEKLRHIEDFIHASTLDKKLLELLKLRISQLNGCAYCLDMHYKELKHLGETELRISLLPAWEEGIHFDEKEKAALTYSEELTQINHRPLQDTTMEKLEIHFNKTEIAYLSLAVTQINTWNRLMKAFGFKAGNYVVSK